MGRRVAPPTGVVGLGLGRVAAAGGVRPPGPVPGAGLLAEISALTDRMQRCNAELEAAFGRVDLAGFDRASARFDAWADRYRDLFGLLEGELAGLRAAVPSMPGKFAPRRRRRVRPLRILGPWRRPDGALAGSPATEPVVARSGRHVLR